MRTRLADIRGEKALGLFLDKYFYPALAEDYGFDINEKKRIHEKAMQVIGMDVTIPMDGKRVNIDEKAALRYIGEELHTFSFEIDFFSEKEEKYVDGWLISRTNKTDYYLIMWIKEVKKGKEKIGRLMAEDFEKVEAFLIDKRMIRKKTDDVIARYARSEGYITKGYEKIHDVYRLVAKGIRDNYAMKKRDVCKGYKFSYSADLIEKPVNILISKDILGGLASAKFVITKEAVVKDMIM